MEKEKFRAWLEKQRHQTKETASSRVSDAARVEKYYGNLDEHHEKDGLVHVLGQHQYSADDERKNAPNPSKIPIGGNNLRKSLASLKQAINLYREYREQNIETLGPDPVALRDEDDSRTRLLGLERDLQTALRDNIEQLESGLEIIDGGVERSIDSGFIDITAQDAAGAIVVIELKAGAARRDAVAQILSYMGDLAAEDSGPIRGILVAGDFDRKALAAARVVPALSLRSYRISFEFSAAEDAAG